MDAWPSGQKSHFFSLEEVGVQIQITAWLLPVFIFFNRIFTLRLFTVYSHCGPVSLERFLRKRISSQHWSSGNTEIFAMSQGSIICLQERLGRWDTTGLLYKVLSSFIATAEQQALGSKWAQDRTSAREGDTRSIGYVSGTYIYKN